MINIIIYVLLAFHVVCSILLTLLVLMQRPKSEGLGAAFGSGVTESIFGAGTSEVLTKMTIWLGSFFIGATLLLAILYAHRTSTRIHQQLLAAPAPAAETSQTTTSAPAEPAVPTSAPTPAEPVPATPNQAK